MSTSPPTTASGATKGRRLVLTAALVVAAVVVLALAAVAGRLLSDGSGADLEPGDTDTAVDVPETQLAHGACVESLEHVADDLLRQVPCAVRHHGQVVATQEITDAEHEGRIAYNRQAEEYCLPTAYQLVPEGVDTAPLMIEAIVPTSTSWEEEGDRLIRCVLGVEADHHLTGSFLAGDVQVHTEPM